MSTTIHEDTMMEEAESPSKLAAAVAAVDNHVTLRDVSAIAKEIEMESDVPHSDDLSVSLLPFLPSTTNSDDDKKLNKSIGSTISDKTFVKTSLKPFSSEEDEDDEDEDADETMMEQSFSLDKIDKSRPLLLTADQSIRLQSAENVKIKQEKVSYRPPPTIENAAPEVRPSKILLSTNPTFKAEKSNFVRPTIVVTNDTSKLSPIASEES